ncbi:MAG: penicillin acylase family protein [Planctomycetia bacterium]|nr:penicillin acylase family protein [Planctomycetia bacterium]
MPLSDHEILRRLGRGEPIDAVCQAAGLSKAQFDAWWKNVSQSRVPPASGTRRAGVRRSVTIARNRWGIPSIFAESDDDLFFGLGYAMAQDRLFQLDFLRRRGAGRLAEILGPDGRELDFLSRFAGIQNVLELDLLARTVGLRRIAEHELTILPAETRAALENFSAGVNVHLDECRDRLPIEFDLLDYFPEPWSALDSLTIEVEFRWYLTGRFPIIVMPELAKRTLGDGPLYRAFLQCEADDECILPPGSYPPSRCGTQPIGAAAGQTDDTGSNNWVVAGGRTHTGKPLLASDPHVYFDAVSWWYEAHLGGGSFNVAGMAYAGMPGIMFGRNERVAWGCTNNIMSQRDLYQEKTDAAHPGCFLYDGRWEKAREREEVILVRGGEPVRKTIRFSRNGPIVDEVLPPAARSTGPVSLRWLGSYKGGSLTALLAMGRAGSAREFREATRPWHVPTFSAVYADFDGHIGYQAVGRVPIRSVVERGYRPGWDPAHQWQGLIPFEGMPNVDDPPRGWLATANNRPAPADFPYPISGTWNDGLRARRIREMIESQPRHDRAGFSVMHQDATSLRARACVPPLVEVLAGSDEPRVRQAVELLRAWDFQMLPWSVAASVYEVFFVRWNKAVIRERLTGDAAALLGGGANGLAVALLGDDPDGWFAAGRRERAIAESFLAALDYLQERLGPDVTKWTWDRLHVLPLRHVLSGRGSLAALLDQGGLPVRGDGTTVCNTGVGGKFEARVGPNYRLIADLAETAPRLYAIDASSQSGHPGSPNYRDQFKDWLAGRYHELPLAKEEALEGAVERLVLSP